MTNKTKRMIPAFTVILAVGALFLIFRPPPPELKEKADGGGSAVREPLLPSNEPKDIIRASLLAYGGSDKIESINEIRLKSVITVFGEDRSKIVGRSTEYYRFPDMVRVDFTFGEEVVIHLYDGIAAWISQGGRISKAPDYLTESLRKSVKHFPNSLLTRALDERSVITKMRPDSFNGKSAIALTLTDGEGDQSRIWIDAATHLMARIDYAVFSSLGADSMSVTMSDYRPVDGIQTALSATIYYNGEKAQQTRIEEVLYNPGLPDTLFSLKPVEE